MSRRREHLRGLHPTRVASPFPLLPVRRDTPAASPMNGHVEGSPRHEHQYPETGLVRGWAPADSHMLHPAQAAYAAHGGLNNNAPRPGSGVYDNMSKAARRRSQPWPEAAGEPQAWAADSATRRGSPAKPPLPERPRHLRLPARPDPHRVYPAGGPVGVPVGVPASVPQRGGYGEMSEPPRAVAASRPQELANRGGPPLSLPALQHASPAALLFARAAQMRLSSPHKKRRHRDTEEEPTSGFSAALRREPPPLPAALQRRLGTPQESTGLGKVRVLLRVRRSQPSTHFSVDPRKKQVTLFDPSAVAGSTAPEGRRLGVAAPKMFAFDGVYDFDDPQSEICTGALVDVVHAVINGNDGCVLCLGQSKTGKTTTMLGGSGSADQLGVIPTAISWLYRGIGEQKQKSGARFSVRVSAVQIAGAAENLRDLLKDHAKDTDQSPGVYLREDPVLGSQLQNQSEIRAETPEKAALFLDSAVAARAASEDGDRSSHLLYTLHVFQYSVKTDKSSGVTGGRSRLHLFDLGSFEKTKVSGLTLSAVGNVIVSIFNAHKHLPCRDSKLVHLFREAMGSLTCQTTIVAHVSTDAALYAETLTTVQLASRIHRMRRRRVKPHGSSGSGGSAEENRPGRLRSSGEESSGRSSSDVDPSSSEQSADTVIYLGPGADECTDGEHPPVYIPSLNSDNRAAMNKALKGSSSEGAKCRSPARTHSTSSTPTHRPAAAPGVPFSPQHRAADKLAGAVPKSPQIKRKIHDSRHTAGAGAGGEKAAAAAAASGGSQEQWVDGPRFSRSRIAEAQKIKTRQETWIDGPSGESRPAVAAGAIPKTARPGGRADGRPAAPPAQGYGFMDDHKKSMISRWVEHQIEAVTTKKRTKSEEAAHRTVNQYRELTQFKTQDDEPVEAKIMTQFKTQDSSEENSPLPERHPRATAGRKMSPEASNTLPRQSQKARTAAEKEPSPPAAATASVSVAAEKPKIGSATGDVCRPSSGASRQPVSSSAEATPTLDEICAQCEQLVDVLSQEGPPARSANARNDSPPDGRSDGPPGGRSDGPPGGRNAAPPDGRSCAPHEARVVADAAQNTDDADSLSEECSEPGKQPSSSSSSDVARGEIIEVEERDEPVPMTDSCLQVTEEDIARCMGIVTKPVLLAPPDLDENGHPLRALSEENLTYASSFSDMYTLRGGSDVDPLYDVPGPCANPLSMLEIPDYGKLCDDLSLTNRRLDGITRLHEFYRDLASQPPLPPPPQTTPLISELLFGPGGGDRSETNSVCSEPVRPVACLHCKTLKKTDSLRHGNYVKSIKDWLALLPDLESEGEEYICDNCRRKQNEELDQLGDDFEIQSDITPYLPTFSNLSSLRHPDGASNPNLSKHDSLVLDDEPPPPAPAPLQPPPPAAARLDERLPGNGASGSDEEAASGGGAGRPPRPSPDPAADLSERTADGSTERDAELPAPAADRGEERRPGSRADQPVHAKPKGSRLGRLFSRGRSTSRSPSKFAKGRYVSAEVCGSICSPRYPERGLKKDKKADKKPTDERKKTKERERKPRSDSTSSGADTCRARQDRVPSLIAGRPDRAARRGDDDRSDWSRGVRREKYNFTCDTTLPAFLPAVSSGYDSGNDSGIGLRKSQKKRKAESSGYESVLPPSECSSLESSQESEEEPRLNKRNGQVQAGSPAHKAGGGPDSEGRAPHGRHGRVGDPPAASDSLRAEITAKAAAKKTWATAGIPVFSRLWHRKPKLPPTGPPA